jgi:ribosomal protein S5
MDIQLEALRKAIDEAARNLAEVEKGRTEPPESAAMINVLRAQLGAMRAIHAALVQMDARLAGFPETVP